MKKLLNTIGKLTVVNHAAGPTLLKSKKSTLAYFDTHHEGSELSTEEVDQCAYLFSKSPAMYKLLCKFRDFGAHEMPSGNWLTELLEKASEIVSDIEFPIIKKK